jgi:putative secretion ATPase (PEP-CTERM system associated)
MFEDFYGLTGKPFQLTPDPQFYFHSLTHRKALSYLGYGLAQGEGFIVITGEVGAGKSTLVEHLVSTIDPGQLTVGQIVTSKLDEDEIVHVVAQSFGLDIEGHDKATALGMIETFLHEEARAGRRCLLIVDESQNLSIAALEELRMFSNFQLGSHPLLQTLLLGQPEFRATLQGSEWLEQLRQRVIATHHLEAMQPEEIQPYIEHRLGRVGWRGHPSFDNPIFAEIYEASGGIPRRINVLANRLMLLGAIEQRDRFDAVMFKTVVAEMARDSEVPESALRAQELAQKAVAEQNVPVGAMHVDESAEKSDSLDLAAVTAMLAERDTLIAELQQAVAELSQVKEQVQQAAPTQDLTVFADLAAKLESLEARVADQESAIRHTLSMLIEWIESDGLKPIAA